MADVAVSASPWYHQIPDNDIGPCAYGRIMLFHIGPPLGKGGGAVPLHVSYVLAGVQTSTFVPPQLFEIKPIGTTTLDSLEALDICVRASDNRFPASQQTALKVENKCACALKS